MTDFTTQSAESRQPDTGASSIKDALERVSITAVVLFLGIGYVVVAQKKCLKNVAMV